MDELTGEDLLIITGDHGNDPCVQSTDHTREFVPVFVYGKQVAAKNLGLRNGFNQIAASVMDFFGYEKTFGPESLL
jgi:phosphopentomutase